MKQVDNIFKWLEALESGEFKQGTNCLGNAEMGYCCLGLGCVAIDVDFNPLSARSLKFMSAVGLRCSEGTLFDGSFHGKHCLTEINDFTNAGFKRIAKLIRSRPEDLFIPEVAKAFREKSKEIH